MSIDEICMRMLDNADLKLAFETSPFVVHLVFYPAGMSQKVVFRASGIARFTISKPPREEELYLVFETEVVQRRREEIVDHFEMGFLDAEEWPEHLWQLRVLAGEIRIELISETLCWSVEQFDDADRGMYGQPTA